VGGKRAESKKLIISSEVNKDENTETGVNAQTRPSGGESLTRARMGQRKKCSSAGEGLLGWGRKK